MDENPNLGEQCAECSHFGDVLDEAGNATGHFECDLDGADAGSADPACSDFEKLPKLPTV